MDEDQALRLTLLGDLDLTTAETLSTRLADLKSTGRLCRLDPSRLAFIDSSGIQAVLLALTDARRIGWSLEVAPAVSPAVERAAQILGIAEVLWPQELAPDRAAPMLRRGQPAPPDPRLRKRAAGYPRLDALALGLPCRASPVPRC